MRARFLEFLTENDDADKPRSPLTLRTYSYNLKWIAERMNWGDTPDDLFANIPAPEDVINWHETNKQPLRRKCFSYCAMKVLHNMRGEQQLSNKYGPTLTHCSHCLANENEQQKRDPKQGKNWVEHSCLKKYAKTLRDAVYKLSKDVLWTKDQYADLEMAFILTYSLKFPPRRELHNLTWSSAISDDEKRAEFNYLDEKKRRVVIHLSKNRRWRTEPYTHILTREMWRLVRLIRKQQKIRRFPHGRVLLNRYWKDMTPNGYSTWFAREMKKCPGCADKRIGCNILRHSKITHVRRNEMTIRQANQFAEDCSHTRQLNEIYRVN